MPTDQAPSLFDVPGPRGSCSRCRDLGLWLTPKGDVQPCPNVLNESIEHVDPSPTAKMIHRAIEIVKIPINSRSFQIAQTLSQFNSDEPCSREDLLTMYFSYLPMKKATQLREFHFVIEELRREWLLPVGSRKDSPAGYWIITDQQDFEKWFTRTKAAPITQLTTIHRVAKRNFPIFAEQLELEFFNDTEPQPPPPEKVAA
jgi:hypothetical protein